MLRRVVKVGGSLLDLPDIWSRLDRWLRQTNNFESILVFGGGALAEAIRDLDRRFKLDEKAAHWWCVQTMSIHAELAAGLLPRGRLLRGLDELTPAPVASESWILEPLAFLRHDDPARSPDPLPESWSVTSDSIAARLAELTAADSLTLLKSASPPAATYTECATAGYVDPFFPQAAAQLHLVQAVDFRQESTQAVELCRP